MPFPFPLRFPWLPLLPAAVSVGACATTLAVYRLARTEGRMKGGRWSKVG
ncbi:hypothetical protein [Hymenobacter nivis]|nr:hypothetical protein [Hymenobacter nivis]